jgi:hypothetical protein
MGHWSMHIEGGGLHDNGQDHDADAMLRVFAGKLADAGHQVHAATITVGHSRELLNSDETTPLAAMDADPEPHGGTVPRPLLYRDREH